MNMTKYGGPLAIVGATSLMAFQDSLVKLISDGLPLWQLFFVRSVMVLPIIGFVLWRQSPQQLRAVVAPWTMLRSLLIVAMYVFFYAGLPLLSLSTVAAVYYTGPLFIIMFSALFLSDRVTLGHAVAGGVAFIGVLFVLRPTGDDFSSAALIPLLSALCYTLAMVTTRARLSVANVWTLSVSLNLVFVMVGGAGIFVTAAVNQPDMYPFLLTAWTGLSLQIMGSMCALAVISIGIHMLLARAYQLGPTPVVAGLDFSYLGFAAVWGLVIFGLFPDSMTLLGTTLIISAGLWSVLRPAKVA